MEALLVRYGYLLLFPGIIVEGEAFLLAAAFMAHRGIFDLPIVIAVAVAATMLGDQLYYRTARSRGRAWLERRGARYQRLIALTQRRGIWLLLASRWAFGLRIVIPATCGAVGMPPLLFTVVDFIAVTIWAIALGLLGYYGGAAVESHFRDLRQVLGYVVIAIVLCVAAILGARRVQSEGRLRELGLADLHALVPFVIGLTGVLDILSAVWPQHTLALLRLAQWLPFESGDASRLALLFAGLVLLQVTRNLARRKELAWWIATIALSLSLLSQLGPRFALQHSLLASVLLCYLLIFRRRFSAQSDPATLRLAFVMAPLILLAIVAYGYAGLSALTGRFTWPVSVTPLAEAVRVGILTLAPRIEPHGQQGARFLASLEVAGWLARLYLLVLLLRPVILRKRQEAAPADVERIRRGHVEWPISAFALRPDKHHLLVADGRGLIAYAVRNSVAVACGDPLCGPADRQRCARDFVEHCRRHGLTPSFYSVAGPDLASYAAAGLKAVEIGEEAVVDLVDAAAAAKGSGQTVRRYDRGAGIDLVLDEQLSEVSDEWLERLELGELHFTFGSFDLDELDHAWVFACGSEARVEAFCTWLPYRDGRGMVLDLLRRRTSASDGCYELLLNHSLAAFAAAGLMQASLGLVPAPVSVMIERGVVPLLGKRLGAVHERDDISSIKRAVGARWEPRHLVYPGERDLRRVISAVVDIHTTVHEGPLLPRLLASARTLVRRTAPRTAP